MTRDVILFLRLKSVTGEDENKIKIRGQFAAQGFADVSEYPVIVEKVEVEGETK